MRMRRLFTVEEQARVDERIRDIAQAFMWTTRKTLSGKVRSSAASLGKVVALVACAAITLIVIIAQMLCGDALFSVLVAAVSILVTAISFVAYTTFHVEKLSAMPPVFLFFNDKLFHIESAGSFSVDQIPKMQPGEIMVIREESGKALTSATNARIEAECYYIERVKEHDIGNDTPGIAITAIENIVDVDIDEDDENSFIIAYEDEYGDEVELALPMREWGELYDWLYQQMFSD